jgi:hypothetical protein
MPKEKVRGRIIRILDKRTVIINLGRRDHIADDSIFNILGQPELVKDPFTGEELGCVSVVKSKLKATQVYEGFTIASTKWATVRMEGLDLALRSFASGVRVEQVDEGELLVNAEDVEPWKAKSESPVRVGDYVEVEVSRPQAGVEVQENVSGEDEGSRAEGQPAEPAAT